MTRSFLTASALAGAFLLAACGEPGTAPAEPTAPPAEDDAIVAPESSPAEAGCSVLESRDWAAWVNRMPGPDAPTVHVTGKVDVNTSGYTFEWEQGPLDRSATPTLILKLIPVPPTDMAMQVISTEEVHYTGAVQAAKYGGVLITCGDETLAQIDDVPDAF